MQCRREVGKIGRPVAEDRKSNCWLCGNILLIQAEAKYTKSSADERDKCTPRIPVIHNATPCEWDQEGCHTGDEDERSNPVDTS